MSDPVTVTVTENDTNVAVDVTAISSVVGDGDLLSTNNLSDVADPAASYSNIKQAATTSATGAVELATQAEVDAGTDANRVVTPETLANYSGLGGVGGSWDGDISDIDLDGGTDIGAALADGDLILVDDGAGGTNRKSALSRVWTYIQGKLSSTYQAILSEGAFVDGDKTKLDGIEAGANVTDAANVQGSGALMDSEVTNLAQVKAFDSSDYATAAQGTLADSALQSGDNISELTNNSGFTTNAGTVTSVSVSGSDGIEVDSGSPITSSGTIVLGVNAASLKSFLDLEVGADVQAYDTLLADIAGLTVSPGDILYVDGSSNIARLAKGTDDQVLTLASGIPSWANASGGSGGAWEYIEGDSLSTADSEIVIDGYDLDSTYEEIRIRVSSLAPVTDDAQLRFTFRDGSADITGSYLNRSQKNPLTGVGDNHNQSSTTDFGRIDAYATGGVDTGSATFASVAEMDIVLKKNTSGHLILNTELFLSSGTADQWLRGVNVLLSDSTVADGVRLYFDSGNIASGAEWKIWGLTA